MIKNAINFILQVTLDFIVGMAVYFGITAMFPSWNTAFIVAISISIAVIFAEKFEVKIK